MAEKTKMTRSVEGKPRSTTSRKGKGKGKRRKNVSASWPESPDQHQHHPFPLLLLLSSSTTQWHDLPREVWQIIFINHLPILDQISFRLVCKYWYKVSCSTKLESLPLEYQQQSLCPTQSPWLMIVKPPTSLWFDPKDQVSPDFVELSTGRVYNMKDYIPDLFKPNSRVLKSAYGWLLVLQRQDYTHYKEDPECAVSPGRQPLFFLNPFTRARIDIHVPHGSIGQSFLKDLAGNNDPQCALSAPPTREDCILFVIIRTCGVNRNFKIVTFLHNSHGGGTPSPPGDFHYCCWAMKQFSAGNVKSVVRLPFDNRVRNVIYWDGIFYCVHAEGYISSYNVSSKEWLMLGRPKMLPPKQQNLDSHGCNFINENNQHDQHDNNNNNSSTTGISDAVDDNYEPDDQDEKPRQICYRRKLAFEPSYPDQKKATHILWIEPTSSVLCPLTW